MVTKGVNIIISSHVRGQLIEIDPFVLFHCVLVIYSNLLVGVDRHHHTTNVSLCECVCMRLHYMVQIQRK